MSSSKSRVRLVSRRDALRFGAGVVVAGSVPALLGCGAPALGLHEPVAVCGPPTHDQIEGPYYRQGAPERAVLTPADARGVPLVIEGRVFAAGCSRGLEGVELDVWQANHDGHYDNDGSMHLPAQAMLLRGRLKTDAGGHYKITTIVPGRYLNGRQYRPSHVHVKLRAPRLRELTTQLYFPDDPFNAVDPFLHPSLVMATEKRSSEWRSRFDFFLMPA